MRLLALPFALGAGCRTDDPDPVDSGTGTAPTAPFEPVAVGFGFDGVVRPDGTLTGYVSEGEARDPVLIVVFVSQAFLLGGDPDGRCLALGRFDPPPADPPVPTLDGVPLFVSYDTALSLTAHSCQGRLGPEWGPDGVDLWGPFDGAHFGLGLGPMTDALRSAFGADTLAALGDAMVSQWIAIEDLDGNWIAVDWTAGILFDVDPATGELRSEAGPDGPVLVPVDASGLQPGDPLPTAYVRSFPVWYQPLSLVDLGGL